MRMIRPSQGVLLTCRGQVSRQLGLSGAVGVSGQRRCTPPSPTPTSLEHRTF